MKSMWYHVLSSRLSCEQDQSHNYDLSGKLPVVLKITETKGEVEKMVNMVWKKVMF